MKAVLNALAVLIVSLCAGAGEAGEVLRSISESSEPAGNQDVEPAQNDRRIIYRVICSPEDEALPDCDKPPLNDTETTAQPEAVTDMPDMPANAEDQAEQSEPVAPVKAAKAQKTKKSVKAPKTASKKKASKAKSPVTKKKSSAKATNKRSSKK